MEVDFTCTKIFQLESLLERYLMDKNSAQKKQQTQIWIESDRPVAADLPLHFETCYVNHFRGNSSGSDIDLICVIKSCQEHRITSKNVRIALQSSNKDPPRAALWLTIVGREAAELHGPRGLILVLLHLYLSISFGSGRLWRRGREEKPSEPCPKMPLDKRHSLQRYSRREVRSAAQLFTTLANSPYV